MRGFPLLSAFSAHTEQLNEPRPIPAHEPDPTFDDRRFADDDDLQQKGETVAALFQQLKADNHRRERKLPSHGSCRTNGRYGGRMGLGK